MSRAFVKENDDVEALPDRPVSPHPNYVTEDGLAKIEAELARVSAACASAQADADRSALAQVARDLRYWQQRRSSAEVVAAPADAAKVQFGSTVTVRDKAGNESRYRIVGIDETDVDRDWVSWRSPIASALLKARLGQRVRFRIPSGEQELEIIAIVYE